MEVNKTALAPGNTCGQRGTTESRLKSRIGFGEPPLEEMRHSRPVESSAAIMLSSSPQLPPSKSVASQRVIGEPPPTAIFLSLPPAQNATHWPSGEKNGP